MTRVLMLTIVAGALAVLPGRAASAQTPPGGPQKSGAELPVGPPLLEFPGGIVWQRALPAMLAAQPAFDQRHAYVPLQNGTVVAVSLLTGSVVWSVPREPLVPPAISGALLIGLDARSVWALDTADGAQRWSTGIPAPVELAPGVSDAIVVLAGTGGELAALGTADGSARWSVPLRSPATAVPVVRQGHVFVGLGDGSVVCVSADSGKQVWSRALGGTIRTVAAADGRVYAGSSDNFLYALDARSGREQWRWRTGGDVVEPAISDGRLVYFAAMDNVVRALRNNGNLAWQFGLGSRPAGAPIIADGLVIAAGIGPEIRAYLPEDGTPAGRYSLTGRLGHAPHFAPSEGDVPARLVIVTGTGTIVALGGGMERPVGPPGNVPGVLRRPRLVVPGPGIQPLDGTVEVADAPMDAVPGVPVPPERYAGAVVPSVAAGLPLLVPMRALPGRPVPPRLIGQPLLILDGGVEPPVGPIDFLPGKALTPEPPPAYDPDGATPAADLTTRASRAIPSTIRSGPGAENESRIMFCPEPST
jgi:outer membrane protein assembly factor BamB